MRERILGPISRIGNEFGKRLHPSTPEVIERAIEAHSELEDQSDLQPPTFTIGKLDEPVFEYDLVNILRSPWGKAFENSDDNQSN